MQVTYSLHAGNLQLGAGTAVHVGTNRPAHLPGCVRAYWSVL